MVDIDKQDMFEKGVYGERQGTDGSHNTVEDATTTQSGTPNDMHCNSCSALCASCLQASCTTNTARLS